ncbi:unnamed protein product [Amoebophrya sp. A120]|nr:unnamed protein product [Amoebophrya sp. A120]|eukprot:GSA120T00005448001.1
MRAFCYTVAFAATSADGRPSHAVVPPLPNDELTSGFNSAGALVKDPIRSSSSSSSSSSKHESDNFVERVRKRAEAINLLRYGQKSLASPDPFIDSRSLQGVQSQYCLITANGLTDHLRNCLQTCHVLDNTIEPRFTQFESFCVEAAGDVMWPDVCYNFMECVLGCKITKEITKDKSIEMIKTADRQDMFEKIDPGNVEAEQRCDMEKCRSYCVRQRLGTCHEIGYISACEAAQRGQYLPCDVDCSSAQSLQAGFATLAATVLLYLLFI